MSMKREITFKSLFLSAALLSLLAFTFVNVRSNDCANNSFVSFGIAQSNIEDRETCDDTRDMQMPDVTVLGRLWDIAQRLMEKTR